MRSFSVRRRYFVRSSFIPLLIFISLFSASLSFAFRVDIADSPTNTLDLTVGAIEKAKTSILLNIYQMDSPEITHALIERVRAGVQLTVLLEGDPVGGIPPSGRKAQDNLIQEMKKHGQGNRFYEMTKRAGGTRRFHFDHAKYAVIDHRFVLIGSENYSSGGQPTGTTGNRGWEVVLYDKASANFFTNLFAQDADPRQGDLIDWTHTQASIAGDASLAQQSAPEHKSKPSTHLEPAHVDASDVSFILSPSNSLSGLISLLKSAVSTLDLELMTFDSTWGGPGTASPLFEEVLAAARRGVKVRVLLNDERAFSHHDNGKPTKNQQTVEALNAEAAARKLNLSARLANVHEMQVSYIHNKGVLVDGDKTLVSSINWNENSVERNREAAVLLTSSTIFSYYERIFNKDWKMSQEEPQWPTREDSFPATALSGISSGCNHEF